LKVREGGNISSALLLYRHNFLEKVTPAACLKKSNDPILMS
jgi:hypothetical protein